MDMDQYRELLEKDELDRGELIRLVEMLSDPGTYRCLSEEEVHRLQMAFDKNVRHPDGLDLLTWPTPEQEAMSPEELVDYAQSYKPI